MSDNSIPPSAGEQPPVPPAAQNIPPAPPAPPYPGTPSYPTQAYPGAVPAYGQQPAYPVSAPPPAQPGYGAAPTQPNYGAPTQQPYGAVQQPGYQQPGYQQPGYQAYGTPNYPVARPTSGLAITSLICALASVVFSWLAFPILAAVVAVITGHMALKQTKANPAVGGRGMAFAGLIIGYIMLGFLALGIAFAVISAIFFGAFTVPFLVNS
ncbi:DUF4190 domain-containing protein [Microbacterium oxydans]|uniref:DUF4190 domain-containing protein n=1 Tax=Microbacterium oxydans TaxID=82380 RepID=A0A0F0L619_9MICO|nr:DUF4190 domain-containing protein [Microbacterium oxydans]KJL27735.1 hypothetical protein RS83_02788 [Microbacterium oxydans]